MAMGSLIELQIGPAQISYSAWWTNPSAWSGKATHLEPQTDATYSHVGPILEPI